MHNTLIKSMAFSSATYRAEPCLDLHRNDKLTGSMDQPTSTLSKLFNCSIHNCLCKRSKIGLVLYPKDIRSKNVILLVCTQCYNYQLETNTQHTQLEQWYFNIYQDSQSFDFKSRFTQNDDSSFSFHCPTLNIVSSFNIQERDLENWEKDKIKEIIQKKLNNV